MDDRTLLERAAWAAGIRLEWDGHPDQWAPMYYEGKTYHAWNPLTSDADALRLAVKLRVDIYLGRRGSVLALTNRGAVYDEKESSDPYAATRRAIVRAAAAMSGDA